jgi:hypothetical protein
MRSASSVRQGVSSSRPRNRLAGASRFSARASVWWIGLDARGARLARAVERLRDAAHQDLAFIGGNTPESMRISVLLPAPLWPSRPTTSPAIQRARHAIDRADAAEMLAHRAHLDQRRHRESRRV